MELKMQSSLEEGEKDLLKIGLETMVRSQGFSEVDFRFIRLTMMTTEGYILKKGLETYVSESRVEGAIWLMSAGMRSIGGYRDETKVKESSS